jgi:hypothetical protein
VVNGWINPARPGQMRELQNAAPRSSFPMARIGM